MFQALPLMKLKWFPCSRSKKQPGKNERLQELEPEASVKEHTSNKCSPGFRNSHLQIMLQTASHPSKSSQMLVSSIQLKAVPVLSLLNPRLDLELLAATTSTLSQKGRNSLRFDSGKNSIEIRTVETPPQPSETSS